MFYGLADKYLFDRRHTIGEIVENYGLVHSEHESIDSLIETIKEADKRSAKHAIKMYNISKISKNDKSLYGIGEYLRELFSDKYIICYKKINDTTIKIIEKREFHNEDMDKYMVLL